MRIDLHVHTSISSPCSLIEPEGVIRTATEIGLDGVCITEHDEIKGAEVMSALGRKHGFPVFRGIETYTELGDMLVYGLYQDPPNWKTPFEELLAMCRETGAVIIPAHPCRVTGELERLHGWERAKYMLGNVAAIETHNGGCSPDGNRAALELGRRYGLPGIGGSDAHHLFQLGRCLTVFGEEVTSDEELVRALKAGRYRGVYPDEFHCTRSNPGPLETA
ncbi:MAG: PHP domain-containing protein [Actinobacteria bacterium]|nr:PHP domain-containing protein [Actinomycetota bacterium]